MSHPGYDIDATFPMPFSSIDRRVALRNPNQFKAALALLARYPIAFTYAVNSPTTTIYCTEQAANLICEVVKLNPRYVFKYNQTANKASVNKQNGGTKLHSV